MEKEANKRKKVLCANCKQVTNHLILFEYQDYASSENSEVAWWGDYQIVKCLGCDRISFRLASRFSEDLDPQTGGLIETIELFPLHSEGRVPMEGYENFPARTQRIYLETLEAFNNRTPILAAIGLRAVIESICLEQKTKSRSLAEGIDKLAKMGLLSQKQAEFLHTHRFMGNAAAHEISPPKPEHLVAALDIAETLLKTIYVLPEIAEQITKQRNLRSRTGRPTGPESGNNQA